MIYRHGKFTIQDLFSNIRDVIEETEQEHAEIVDDLKAEIVSLKAEIEKLEESNE